jgi:hypothetical protein
MLFHVVNKHQAVGFQRFFIAWAMPQYLLQDFRTRVMVNLHA